MKKLFIAIILLPYTINAQIIKTIAGNGNGATSDWSFSNCLGGYNGDGVLAIDADLNNPNSVAVDVEGNVYIADGCNQRIRMVNTSGIITTIAGNGTAGFSGDGGLATNAELNLPRGIAIDGSGNIYFADYDNHRVRKVNTSGIITTIAGNGVAGLVGDNDGSLATDAELNLPTGVAVSRSGNIYIADINNGTISRINTFGIISTVVGLPGWSFNIAVDGSDNIYYADESSGYVFKTDTLGIITLIKYGLNSPFGVAVDNAGNIYVANTYSSIVNKIDILDSMTIVAGNGVIGSGGDGGLATNAELNFPDGIAIDASGNIFFTEFYGQRVRQVGNNSAFVNNLKTTCACIEIFPNPAKNEITITATDKITNVKICNLLGKTVLNQDYTLESVQINIKSFPMGMYFVKVNNQFIQKIIKE